MARSKTDRSAEEAATALVAALRSTLVPMVRDEVQAAFSDPDYLLGLPEVVARYGVSLRTVKGLIAGPDPKLASRMVGGARKVRQGDVAALAARGWQ